MNSPRLLEACEWVFVAVVALGSLTSFTNAWGLVWIPYQLNFAEGVILNGVQRVMEGQALYPASREFPVIIHQYGPLYYYLGAGLLKWLGMAFAPLRLLTMASGMAVVGLLALILHHLTASWKLGVGFGFLFLTLPVVQDWLPLARVDIPGVALSLAGLYLYLRFCDHGYLSIPFFLGAIYCKYTLAAAPVACFLDLVIRKRVKQAVEFGAIAVLLSALAFLELQRTTGGAFAFDTLASHADPFTFRRVLGLLQLAVQQYALLIALGFGLIIGGLRSRMVTVPPLYLACSTLTLMGAGKFGSDTNHLLEWTAILCLCGGLTYHNLRQQAAESTALLLVLAVLTLFILATLRAPWVYPGHTGCPDAFAYIKQHTGRRVLAEDVGAVVLAGKPVQLSDPFVWTWLVKRGGWSDTELQSLVRARAFDAVILSAPIDWQRENSELSRWPAPVLDALQQNYRPARSFACRDAAIAYEPFAAASP